MASIAGSIWGDKPKIVPFIPTDYTEQQRLALEGDLAAWPDISRLGDLFQQSYLEQLNAAIPGFSDILKMGGTTTQEMLTQADQELKGQIPQDVVEQVQRSSAFQNLLSGGGGAMASANTARNLGLTSLDLINQGANLAGQAGNAAQRWAGVSGAGAAGNVMQGMLVTPQQRAAFQQQQNQLRQQTLQAQANVNAAPVPGLQQLNQWVEKIGGAVIGTYLGAKPGTDYSTKYDPSQYMGGPSDVSNPGYYVPSGTPAGPSNQQTAFSDPFGLGNPTQNPANYNTASTDLWSSFQGASPGYNPFNFGAPAGPAAPGYAGVANPYLGTTGTTDFTNPIFNYGI